MIQLEPISPILRIGKHWVTTVVTRNAGRVKYWEIWNEPDSSDFFTGNINQLVTYAQHAYTIIKSIDPSAKVISPPVFCGR